MLPINAVRFADFIRQAQRGRLDKFRGQGLHIKKLYRRLKKVGPASREPTS